MKLQKSSWVLHSTGARIPFPIISLAEVIFDQIQGFFWTVQLFWEHNCFPSDVHTAHSVALAVAVSVKLMTLPYYLPSVLDTWEGLNMLIMLNHAVVRFAR